MNEKLTQLMELLLKEVENGSAFIKEQAPEIAKEILMWKWYSSLFEIITLCILTALSIFAFKILGQKMAKTNNDFIKAFTGASCAVLITLIVVTSIAIPHDIATCIKIKTAPRLVIIDYIKKQIRH